MVPAKEGILLSLQAWLLLLSSTLPHKAPAMHSHCLDCSGLYLSPVPTYPILTTGSTPSVQLQPSIHFSPGFLLPSLPA